MKLTPKDIPADFPVRPLEPGELAVDLVTCGTCGLAWDDAVPTGWTPAPGARCPFEGFHPVEPEVRRYYVTMTWDDFPEGGSFGTVVRAKNWEEAEAMCRAEMAVSRLDERDLDDDQTEEEALEAIQDDYGHEWFVIDCFDLDEFIERFSDKERV